MAEQLQLTFVNFTKGAYIIVEGKQNADHFFIIRQGKVQISKSVEVVAEEGGNVLGPGDFFGVVSTMSSHSHIETAQAITDVTLISVAKEQYSQLIQNNTPIALKIIQQFSRRMRYLDDALTRLTLKSTGGDEDSSHLFSVAEYYAHQSQYSQAFYAYGQYLKFCPNGENTALAKERLKKIAPYVKVKRPEFKPDEFNRTYPKDVMLFAEGESGDELYIIQKGAVKISKIVDNQEVLLAVLKAGDIFGEMALLESKPRAASATAYEACQVLAVNQANFERMIQTQPQIIARLTTLLSERIWLIYKQLANTLIEDPVGRMYDALQIQLEKKQVKITPNADFIFDFGSKELISMVGLPPREGMLVFKKMLENKKIVVFGDKVRTTDVSEIGKQVLYYQKMQKIAQTRKSNTIQPAPPRLY